MIVHGQLSDLSFSFKQESYPRSSCQGMGCPFYHEIHCEHYHVKYHSPLEKINLVKPQR